MILLFSPLLQFEAAWALTNICCGTPDQIEAVVSACAIPILVKILGNCADLRTCDQALWALGI